MRVIELTAYEKVSTRRVHLVGSFPTPRTEGTSQCGQNLSEMRLLTVPLNEVEPPQFCYKCLQLLDLKSDFRSLTGE